MSETVITEPKAEDARAQTKGSFFRNDVTSMLVKNEEIIIEGQISLGIYWKAIAVFIFGILLALMVWELGALLIVTALLMFAYATIKKEILLLVVTNKRVLVRYGILQVDVVDVRFNKIESVELERMPPGYLMGYANVVIMGTGQRFIVIPYVGNASEVRQVYNRLTLEKDELLDDEGE